MEELSIIKTQDGSDSIFSERFGVSYHSRYGAIQESRHVFLQSGLYPRLQALKQVAVLEAGLGTGLNALLTCLEAEKVQKHIRYVALEAFPLSTAQADTLNYAGHLGEAAATILHQIHHSQWGQPVDISPWFTFEKRRIAFENFEEAAAFDVVYFDAFAPNAQPELWEAEVLGRMYRALREDGVFVTYCAKGAVKRCLKSLGFTIEALPGPPGKREMTRGLKVTPA
ncbi:tRNA (5-methylaminomethyl-2-thiouridine)(34)-methyltransferase MnmD [Phaeodactylibacter xiamenensis]|uniref:tRNA (5-methylaminomethyl-2-thiouridine)(34)-methyltransferase MnmD n=1 Tax=Phaeodactylibacter xiamenensis TaxID=1524460 RepID=UPI003CCC1A79